MGGSAAGWVFDAGLLLAGFATALLFTNAVRRDRRLAWLLIPAGASAALLLVSFSFYGQLSVEVSGNVFQAFLVMQLMLVAVLIYVCRRHWGWAILLGALDLVIALPAAAIGAMALANSWL